MGSRWLHGFYMRCTTLYSTTQRTMRTSAKVEGFMDSGSLGDES